MQVPDEGTATRPELLARAGDWSDGEAWTILVRRYEPLLRSLCRQARLSGDESDEVVQRVWIDLARRLGSFRYDPSRRFRGWLATLGRSRIVDILRARNRAVDALRFDPASPEPDDDDATALGARFEAADRIQQAVRARVSPETWEAFWLVSVEGLGLKEAADRLGKTRAAVFEARKRVERKLRDEADRSTPCAGGERRCT